MCDLKVYWQIETDDGTHVCAGSAPTTSAMRALAERKARIAGGPVWLRWHWSDDDREDVEEVIPNGA